MTVATRLLTLLFAALMVTLGWTAYAHACEPEPVCATGASLSEGSPSCLRVHGLDGGGHPEASACISEVQIDNECDQAVEIVELGCGDDCLAPVRIEAGSDDRVAVRTPPQDGTLEQTLGWSLGDDTGTIDVVASHDSSNLGACGGCLCQQTPSVPPPEGLLLALVLGAFVVGPRCRRHLRAPLSWRRT